MPIKITPLIRQDFEGFCDENNIVIEVKEVRANVWRASGRNFEVSENLMLVSHFEDGDTPRKAVRKFARYLQGKYIIKDAYRESRVEMKCPVFTFGPMTELVRSDEGNDE